MMQGLKVKDGGTRQEPEETKRVREENVGKLEDEEKMVANYATEKQKVEVKIKEMEVKVREMEVRMNGMEVKMK